jgi:hypothetical protein
MSDDTERVETDEETAIEEEPDVTGDRAHLDGLEPGAGCAEVWEHLSERRDAGSD